MPRLRFFLLCLFLTGCGKQRPEHDVVLVILDSLRADHLSSYGYPRETTPHLDRLATEAERFERAYAQSPSTLPAIATILTGQPPHVHGAGVEQGTVVPVHQSVKTLGRRMKDAGYRTAAFMNDASCEARSGLADGFDHFHVAREDTSTAEKTTKTVIEWLDALGQDRLFLVVHYGDPRLPYDPPSPYDVAFEPDTTGRIQPGFGSRGEVQGLRSGAIRLSPRQVQSLVARYDGEIAYMDHQIGKLRAALERLGRWEGLVMVVIGDHGEEFADHGGFEHGHTHYRELIHVPLLLKNPSGQRGVVRQGIARQLDVAPTLCRLLGIPDPPELPGVVLGTESARFAVAEGTLWGGDLVSVRSDQGTLVRNRTTRATLFFSTEDVLEKSPVPAGSEARRILEGVADALPMGRSQTPLPWAIEPSREEQLRSLGYIQ